MPWHSQTEARKTAFAGGLTKELNSLLIFSVNELMRVTKARIYEKARVGLCKEPAGYQTANSSTIDCQLVPITVLDDRQKNLLLEAILLQQQDRRFNDIHSY